MAFGGKKAAPFVKGGGRKGRGKSNTAAASAASSGGAPKFGTPEWQAKYGKGKKKKSTAKGK